MCTTFSHNFKNITQNGQNQSCDTIALKRRYVWTQLQDKNPELYDKLKPNEGDPRRHSRFPSTFLTTNSPEPLPIYT